MFTKAPWNLQTIDGITLASIKLQLDNLFLQKSNGIYEDFLDFLEESNVFKVID